MEIVKGSGPKLREFWPGFARVSFLSLAVYNSYMSGLEELGFRV